MDRDADKILIQVRRIYLDLMKKSLTDLLRTDRPQYFEVRSRKRLIGWTLRKINKILSRYNHRIVRFQSFSPEKRMEGRDWPAYAETMIGLKRIDSLENCMENIIKNNIPGDFIETGVWRGGAVIFMKAFLKSHGVTDRKIWVADSFKGLPEPDEKKYSADRGDRHHTFDELRITREVVINNFKKYNLWDDSIHILEGWFKDTLPMAPIEKLSLIRLDGDMYESTLDGLVNLYPKLSKGGYLIIDDWGAVPGCRKAVLDYRQEHGINDEIINIDWTGIFWKKS